MARGRGAPAPRRSDTRSCRRLRQPPEPPAAAGQSGGGEPDPASGGGASAAAAARRLLLPIQPVTPGLSTRSTSHQRRPRDCWQPRLRTTVPASGRSTTLPPSSGTLRSTPPTPTISQNSGSGVCAPAGRASAAITITGISLDTNPSPIATPPRPADHSRETVERRLAPVKAPPPFAFRMACGSAPGPVSDAGRIRAHEGRLDRPVRSRPDRRTARRDNSGRRDAVRPPSTSISARESPWR